MLHRFVVLTAVLTLPLIYAGATVTTLDAGLSVPDWPLSYGGLTPRMVGNIRYEHFHRLIAALVGLFTLIIAVGLQKTEPRRWVRVLGWVALGAVLSQGTLGGLTVLNLQPPALSAIHGCLAQAFFALMACLALFTSPNWIENERLKAEGLVERPWAAVPRGWTIAAAAAVYVQVIFGAVVRHLRAALAIPDFPLSFGVAWPPADRLADPAVFAQFVHRLGAVAVLIVAGIAIARALRTGLPALRKPAIVLSALLPVQVLLGAATVWSGREYVPATLHVAVGALVLVTSVTLAVAASRLAPSGPDGAGRGAAEAGGSSPRVREALV